MSEIMYNRIRGNIRDGVEIGVNLSLRKSIDDEYWLIFEGNAMINLNRTGNGLAPVFLVKWAEHVEASLFE